MHSSESKNALFQPLLVTMHLGSSNPGVKRKYRREWDQLRVGRKANMRFAQEGVDYTTRGGESPRGQFIRWWCSTKSLRVLISPPHTQTLLLSKQCRWKQRWGTSHCFGETPTSCVPVISAPPSTGVQWNAQIFSSQLPNFFL